MSVYTTSFGWNWSALASLLGLLGVLGGIQCLVSPQSFAENSESARPFIALAGARNFGAGFTIVTLLALQQRKAAGITLMCGASTAFADAWISVQYKAGQKKAAWHAVVGLAMCALGNALYQM
ncbi:MAG: hypothetical protein LQ346_003829 [Caloplaca aetnensis]|nr:MAG: hypothetical protein LQ346_003829 [Caloplaca aetnensis]